MLYASDELSLQFNNYSMIKDRVYGNELKEYDRSFQVASDTLFAVNDIMKANEKVLAKAQISMNTSTKIVKSVEKISISIAESLNETHSSFTFTDSNLAMSVSLVNQNHSSTSVVTYNELIQRETTLGIYQDNREVDFATDKSMNGMLVLPGAAVTSNKSIVLRSVTYRKGVFFLNQHQLDNITSGGRVVEHAVGSNVLSVSIGEEEKSTELEEPVTISFRNDSQSIGTGVIMFWDFEIGNYLFFSWNLITK